jgi:mRNA interferase HigB
MSWRNTLRYSALQGYGLRVIFDLGRNKYRLIVQRSFAFGRVLVKFTGTHAEYDRIDPEAASWRKK